MTKLSVFVGLLLLAAVMPIQAQDTMRATLRGNSNGDRGKCTIEVNIDDAAEVEIAGDTARLRTLAGQPAQWRRFECNGIMPRRVSDFRFTGVDGRGRQTLIRDPRQTGGTAVVRLEDPKGGREGYTFDIEWQSGGGPGYPGGGYPGGGYPGRPNPGWGNGGGGRNSFVVNCAADGRRRRYCNVDTSRGVRLLRETGNAPCRQGSNWGYDQQGIWVDRGCAADFEVRR
jgi:hypothetical protein